MNKKIISILIFLLISGCASRMKEYAWFPSYDSGVKFDQAIAKCEYDLNILGKGNERITAAIFGIQSPIFEKCMNQYGYKWEKKSE